MPILKDKYLSSLTLKSLKDRSFKILAEGDFEEMIQSDGKKEKKFVLPIKLSDGTDILYIPNSTSAKILRKRYGNDTAKWVGKKAAFCLIKQNVRGEIKEVVFVAMEEEEVGI